MISGHVPRDRWTTPNLIGRIRSEQAGNPSGILGRLIGRAMVKVTWAANRHNLELLGDVSGKTVLDIGFGQGRMAEALAQADAHVLGAEVSDTMLTQATARNRQRIEDGMMDLRVGDGVHLPFDDGVAAWKDPAVYRAYLTDEVVGLVTDAGFRDVTTQTQPGQPTDIRWLTATT